MKKSLNATATSSMSAAQYNTLNNVAVQCPIAGGLAVYRARVMLNWMLDSIIEYTDNCESTPPEGLMHKPVKTQSNPIIAKVYPNPANNLLNVSIAIPKGAAGFTICLYNSEGGRVMCETLSNDISTFSINQLSSGIYYYRILDGTGNLVKADKVTIIH